jgi:hypothetical protein
VRVWPRPRLGVILLAAMFAIALAQSALSLNWDDAAPLWDKAVHFGAALGAAIALADRQRAAASRVAIVMGLGFAWEVAQFLYEWDALSLSAAHLLDTAGDLVADLAGAISLNPLAGQAPVDDALHV